MSKVKFRRILSKGCLSNFGAREWAVFLMALDTSVSGDSFEGSFRRGLLRKPDPSFDVK